jgi:hypothetical protein
VPFHVPEERFPANASADVATLYEVDAAANKLRRLIVRELEKSLFQNHH